MSVPEFWLAAAHEAGHIIANLERGNGVVDAWVNPDGTGGCQPRGRGCVIGCLAGPYAEWKIARRTGLPTPADFQRSTVVADVKRAIQLLGSDDHELLLRCWIEASQLLDREWRAVMRLTEALVRYDRLSGERAERIWRGTPRGP